jgi:anti-sigma regulatory factor (Ser/Thr protein kinase)
MPKGIEEITKIYLSDLEARKVEYERLDLVADIQQLPNHIDEIEEACKRALHMRKSKGRLVDFMICTSELVTNAIKDGNHEKGEVSAYVFANQGYLYLGVRDYGKGFDLAEKLEKGDKQACTDPGKKDHGRGLCICDTKMDALYNQINPSMVFIAKKLGK